jgi:hypothetical protein
MLIGKINAARGVARAAIIREVKERLFSLSSIIISLIYE